MHREYNQIEKMYWCLVSIFIEGEWKPIGLSRRKTDLINSAGDMAESLSKSLEETGKISCIVPTESWSFITIDVSTYPIKVSPFLEGVELGFEQTNFEFAKLQAVHAIS